MKETIRPLVLEILDESMVHVDEPMSRHTTFRIGGPADLLLTPERVEEIAELCCLFRQRGVPYLVLGNGSNILVGDGGIRGVVIQLGNRFANCEVVGDTLKAQGGIKLSRLAGVALENSLSGLEFAAGIPGTFGGALFMNAGAYDGEMSQVVKEVIYLDGAGDVQTATNEDCSFGYRTSIFSKNPDLIVLGGTVKLEQGNQAEIRAKMDDLAQRRVSKQPLHLPSAGSTFKRPEGHFAGKLIQDAGLMGLRVGGASVSDKHAGFVVNDQGATAKDVRQLMEEVQRRVYQAYGVMLEPEVRFLGEF
ncbi:MAG: UDP-N-acetylmuramate dehydrogenase [Clostridia bacterium]|nr:UDP-N-acetylmuramate dehydrogenase [Clostridia bacterium]